ncbi:MAG: tyrosine--tRNA ligase [Candidatus Omnitrophota bacterium]
MNIYKEIARQLEVIKENTVDLISLKEITAKLENSLQKNTPLKLKIGFDPTARDIHLGHTVLLRKLRKLQAEGHWVYLIIGDFTAKIGDPSGRTILRPILSEEEIKDNASTYVEQAFKILDKKKTKVIYNSVWYKDKTLAEFLSLLSSYTVARILERDDFSQRIKHGQPLTILELIYPLIQGYDSVMVASDIEFGGTDQKFNLIVGRHLQQIFGQLPQGVITMPLLIGLDGKNKMSKSLGNYVGITQKPKDMFGKIMSVSDELMREYFRLLTDYDCSSIDKMHPKEAKLLLAQGLVSFYHSKVAGKKEKEEFERVFSEKKIPKKLPIYKAEGTTLDLIEALHQAKLVFSKNEARRLLSQGAISFLSSLNSSQAPTVLKEQVIKISSQGIILKVGKKKFLKIIR